MTIIFTLIPDAKNSPTVKCVAMITGILFQILQPYRLCKSAKATTALGIILPAIDPEQYFDDRPADTLDAIYDGEIGNLKTLLTQKRLKDGKR